MKIEITMRYVMTFSNELRKNGWELCEHDHYIAAHNMHEDIRVVIPKELDEFNNIKLWGSGTLLDSFSTITMLDMYLKGLVK